MPQFNIGINKWDLGESLTGIMGFWGRNFPCPLAKSLGFGCYFEESHCKPFGLSGMILPFTFSSHKWDAIKSHFFQCYWTKAIIDYAIIVWDKVLKESKKETIYDDVLAKFNMLCRGNELVYHMSNDKIVWHIIAPNVGLVTHA